MKCKFGWCIIILTIVLLTFVLTLNATNAECDSISELKKVDEITMDFDYMVSQLYLQHCTFVEIGEGVCSLFVELILDNGYKKPLRRQMFFGNCLCSEFHKWHLCSYPLTCRRNEDCEFKEATSYPSSSARVHRRLCDVTGMSQWNAQCNCSVTLAGTKQEHMCGFKTCYASPLPKSICSPRNVCGTAHCDTTQYGSLYSVHCDRKCRYHQPFCEDPTPATSLRRAVSSEWAEWTPLSSSDSECNVQQFETECLDERKEPAFDCLGPGLLCCGKEESDCTCEVKVQDGRLKAFRYMIKFENIENQCDSKHLKLKVRSTGLKGDAKVWNRFIGAASRDDNTNSVSMFGKPLGFEAYFQKYSPKEHNVTSEIVRTFQNSSELNNDLFHQLVVLSNHSHSEKSNMRPDESNNNLIQGNSSHSTSANGTVKIVNHDSFILSTNHTSDPVKSISQANKETAYMNMSQLQKMLNGSESSLNKNLQKQFTDKDSKNLNEFTLPYTNITYDTEMKKKNYGRLQKIEGIKITNSDVNAKSTDGSKTVEENNNLLNTNPKMYYVINAVQNNDTENLSRGNQEFGSDNATSSEISNNPSKSTAAIPVNQNIALDKTINNSWINALNDNTRNKIENSQQFQEVNFQNGRNESKGKDNETDQDKKKLKSINQKRINQDLSTEQESMNNKHVKETTNKNSHNDEGMYPKTNDQGNKIEVANKANKIKNLESENNKDKSTDGSSEMMKLSQERYPDQESKINEDTSRGNKSFEAASGIASKQDIIFGPVHIRENQAKGQENSSVDDEEKTELKSNEYSEEIFPVQEKTNKNEPDKEKSERSTTFKLTNQEITVTQNAQTKPSTREKVSTERIFTNLSTEKLKSKEITERSLTSMSHSTTATTLRATSVSVNLSSVPTVLSGETKQKNINNLSSNVNLTNEHPLSDSTNNGNRFEQKSQKALFSKPSEAENTFVEHLLNDTYKQKYTTSGVVSNLKKEQFIKNQASDKKMKINEIANILPNYTPEGVTAPPSKRKLRPHIIEPEDKMNIQTTSTPDLLGSIARKILKSHSILNDHKDTFRMLSDSNPPISLPEEKTSNDYDEPEPVLKDLNKVDRENVDETMTEALNKVAGIKTLPGKVKWSEKSDDHSKLDFENAKRPSDNENVHTSGNIPTVNAINFKKKRLKGKLKT